MVVDPPRDRAEKGERPVAERGRSPSAAAVNVCNLKKTLRLALLNVLGAVHVSAPAQFGAVEADEVFFRDEVHLTFLHRVERYLGLDEDGLTERGVH